jgi:hypothetical protein
MNKDEVIRDLIWAIEVLRGRLPDNEANVTASEYEAIFIQERAMRFQNDEIFKKAFP